MNLSPVPDNVAHAGLCALKSVCLSNPTAQLTKLHLEFLSGVQKYILQSQFDIDSLNDISPAELSRIVTIEEFKKRIIWACIVAAAIDGTVDPAEVARIQMYAEALKIDMAPVKTAWNLANQNLLLARLDIIRKSLPGYKVRQTVQNEGLLVIIRQFFPLAGVELPDVTARYQKLYDYPEGTLGKEFINYLGRNHFPLPGQKGAGPEIIVTHDCLHILGDYGTSASEEIEVASFQAGCYFGDPIYGLLFGLAQYHLDIQVAPVAASQKLQANPEKMIAAFARGCLIKKDMWADFNPWNYFDRKLEDLRSEFGIEPK